MMPSLRSSLHSSSNLTYHRGYSLWESAPARFALYEFHAAQVQRTPSPLDSPRSLSITIRGGKIIHRWA